jgi:hypothetical protein
MKRKFTKPFALLLLAGAIITGCGKSSEKTKSELLTGKTWSQIVRGYDENMNWTIEESESYLYTCDKDNVWTFRNDSTLIADEGANRCYNATQYIYDWSLSSDGNKITIDGRIYTIKTLDSYTLEIYYDYQSSSGPARFIRKWSH